MIGLFFRDFIGNYQKNVVAESASHLVEISYQVSRYLEEKIDNDWKAARSIAGSITVQGPGEADNLFARMRRERSIWGIRDVLVCTQDGLCINADGEIVRSDGAGRPNRDAGERSQRVTLEQSIATFAVPVESDWTLHGSRIVEVAIVRDMHSFIDDMDFFSFNGEGFLYLAQSGGEKISQLTHPKAPDVSNVQSLFDDIESVCLSRAGCSVEETMHTPEVSTFLCRNGSGSWYAVIMPVEAGDTLWQLCYWVPETVVNATMDGFTSYITGLSIAIIVLFSACGFILFIVLYRSRKRRFDSAILARDRMFDLLVRNTQNAFALLSTKHREPLYCSSNVWDIIGYEYIGIAKEGGAYRMVTSSGEETQAIRLAGRKLAGWDGKSEFVSDYIPYAAVGAMRYFVLRLYPTQSTPDEFVEIVQDVTREREREDALKDALAMADSANLAKTRFLANMSHDIRTPMNAIMNMTRFAMENANEPEAHRQYLKTILDSSDHLLHIINDILDMSRIESGQALVAAELFDLHKCLCEVCEMIRPLCAARRQEFVTDFGGVRPVRLTGDSVKLSQVLINLLNNAVKFTQEGGIIRFTAEEVRALRAEFVVLRFTVRDNGMGISPELIPRLFDPFVRVENARVRNIEGTGLGLSICKNYVTAMGGTIACESEPEKGSTFVVELPFEKDLSQPAAAGTSADAASLSFAGRRALLCEDNAVNRLIAGKLLGRLGFVVDTAEDGVAAVERFLASPPDFYDIVFMDIQMPNMDGYAATGAIRASGHPRAGTIPVVAMTANVFAEDVEKSRVAGMNAHIGKPIVVKELILAIDKALKAGETRRDKA